MRPISYNPVLNGMSRADVPRTNLGRDARRVSRPFYALSYRPPRIGMHIIRWSRVFPPIRHPIGAHRAGDNQVAALQAATPCNADSVNLYPLASSFAKPRRIKYLAR